MGLRVTTFELLQAAVVFSVPVVLGIMLGAWMSRRGRRTARAEDKPVTEVLIFSLRVPVIVLSFLLGIYLASQILRETLHERLPDFPWATVDVWLLALTTLTGFYMTYKAAVQGAKAAVRRAGGDPGSTVLISKLMAAVFFAIAFVTVINQLGVNIGPVMASLGVAGIAIALGLQDTLGNYFAGLTIAFDKPFRPGDYVRLQTGEEGFVERIGWRSTHIKPFGETTVIVPNSKLTGEIVTNSFYPDLAVRVYVSCGVSYDSDLEYVEQLCVRVGEAVANRIEGADAEFAPIVRFNEFADSNINFTVTLRAMNFGNSFLLRHEYIKALHAEFKREGISINYPVRQIIRMEPEGEEAPPRSTPLDKDVI